jgi:protocatechuate 3,4-dioxygenase beta subunit
MTELDRTLRDSARARPLPTMVPTYEGRPLAHPDEPVFDQGLAFDLETELSRRKVLKLIGYGGIGAGLLTLAACGPSASSSSASASSSAAATSAAATAAASSGATTAPTPGASVAPSAAGGGSTDCDVIPEETAGPFPGDGSNGPNVLIDSGVVRKDITRSFGEFSGTAEGLPLTIRLIIQDVGNNCAPIVGAAVYAWHCTAAGAYSLYSEGVTEENFLRGVQEADANGVVEFTSIYPGCYPGRWPHIHFEVYPSLDTATDEGNKIATSQIAMPEDASAAVYATEGYESSVRPFRQTSLEGDNVFGDDGGAAQLGAASGDASSGYVVELTVPVRA